MRANRAYHLIASRGGPPLTAFADDERRDRIELTSVDDGEVVLYWELPVRLASRLLRQLRADLAGMQAAEFIDKWQDADVAFEDEHS